MKFKFLFSLLLGAGALSAFAQGGYQDGIDYYNADRFEDAQEILNKTLNEPSTDKALSYFYLGSIDLRDGKTASAKEFFNKGVSANPDCAYNYVGLGQIALAAGDKKTAQDEFKQALKLGGKDAKVMAAVARAYYNVDPVTYAKEIDSNIKNAMKASKNLESAVYVLQGDMVTNDPGKAAGLYEQAITYDQDKGIVNPEAYVKYANVYIKVNPKFAIDKLIELNNQLPTSALAQRELAEKYYDNNQFTRAAEQYGKYMANPNHFQRDEQRYSGLLYFGKDYEKSLQVANQVLAADPNNPYMQRMVMLNQYELGNLPAAIAAGQKLFGTPGAEFTANDYTTYGDALYDSKDYQGALDAYQNALKVNPEKWNIYSKVSSAYTGLEQYGPAAEAQQMFVDNGGDDVTLTDLFV
ncbi:MAG: tetratricopeptide repeat protein, partial [Muribaculaceae bacterium]|nr:tetratricopeptide repeat protein [Muribaculaceae bacterium]